MRRDKKLIRKLLIHVQENANARDPIPLPEFSDFDPDVVAYHTQLCVEAGFLNVKEPETMDDVLEIVSLTWNGHDYLDKLNGRCNGADGK